MLRARRALARWRREDMGRHDTRTREEFLGVAKNKVYYSRMKILPFFQSLICVLLLAALCAGCKPQPSLQITTQVGMPVSFQIEIADTDAAREQGLQNRATLADNQGMLFVFPDEQIQTFWMKNTELPLDMIFINADKKIVGIVANATPFSLTPLYVSTPSRYVLEIKGGLTQSLGIHTGDLVNFKL